MDQVTIRQPDDMHLHLRLEPLLSAVLPHSAKQVRRAVVMPNTRPRAIRTASDITWYLDIIMRALSAMPEQCDFIPMMTIEITDHTTPKMVEEARRAGAVAGKVYPRGVTTNSDEGLSDFTSPGILETFEAMRDCGMLLLLHGELDRDRVLVTEREEVFLPTLVALADQFPDLNIVLEHASSRAAVHTVRRLGPNVAATITAHHLRLTLNDVIGYGIQPHNGCMPTPKGFDDRDALIEAATSGNPKFFLGSDSAPHLREKKECARGACGVYSAPVLLEALAEVFEDAGALHRLEDFTSRFGAMFYGLPLNPGTITLTKAAWQVPDEIDGIVPYRAGETLRWRVS